MKKRVFLFFILCAMLLSLCACKSHTHVLVKVERVEATCTTDGNVEYWHCLTCDKLFSDVDAETEITDCVIPAAGHELSKTTRVDATCTMDGNVEYWTCSECEKLFSDEQAETEITDCVIPATGHGGEFEYNYETKKYTHICPNCDLTEEVEAGGEDFPLLARGEDELTELIADADNGCFIMLANDITVTTGAFAVIQRIPEGGTLDLGGHTVTVNVNCGFVVEGTNVTLQNGYVATDFAGNDDPKHGYALFIGDEGDDNFVTVKNVHTTGGINVYNCEATFIDCEVDASEYLYYALWGDEHSKITVESGVYIGRDMCIHSTVGDVTDEVDYRGVIVINGGEFRGRIIATDLTVINGGEFDSEISVLFYNSHDGQLVVGKGYDKELNIVCGSQGYELTESEDADGNTVYTTQLIQED